MANPLGRITMAPSSVRWLILVWLASAPTIWGNEQAPFNAHPLMTDRVLIEWRPVPRVNATCQQQSRERGHNGFGYTVEACAFWQKTLMGYQCTIYTSQRTTMATLGHEVRHCFQGQFH